MAVARLARAPSRGEVVLFELDPTSRQQIFRVAAVHTRFGREDLNSAHKVKQ